MQPSEKLNEITSAVIGAAINAHRALGPGLADSSYRACPATWFLTRTSRGIAALTP